MKTLSTWLSLLFCGIAITNVAADDREIFEIRFYHFRSAESAAKFDSLMEDALLPLMKNQGIGPVGVFTVLDSKELNSNARVLLVPYESFQSMLALHNTSTNSPDFLEKAKGYLEQEPGNPAFERVESMLLHAFAGMPQLKVPGSGEGKSRRFELRTYKSENEVQGRLKVKMFNDAEIALFEKVGLSAVFYGEALVASNLPQLTYMLVHDDESAQKQSWKTFLADPGWEKLKTDPEFSGIRLKIIKHMLSATKYSPIK